MSGGLSVTWSARRLPLEPVGVAARGLAARRLADRVITAPGPWRGVVGEDLIVVLGDELPWADGVVYLGHSPDHPALLYDTRSEPNVPLAWLVKRLCREGPVAWLREPDLLVPLASAAPFHAPALQAWRNR